MSPDEVIENDARILMNCTIEYIRAKSDPKARKFRETLMLKHLDACKGRHGMEMTQKIQQAVLNRIREIVGDPPSDE